MSIKFTSISSILLVAAVSMSALEAKAEEPKSLADSFEEAYFKNANNFFGDSNILGQLNSIVGIPAFPDQQVTRDGKAIDSLYQDALKGQSQVGAPLRTRDIQSPYTTSIMENPSYLGN